MVRRSAAHVARRDAARHNDALHGRLGDARAEDVLRPLDRGADELLVCVCLGREEERARAVDGARAARDSRGKGPGREQVRLKEPEAATLGARERAQVVVPRPVPEAPHRRVDCVAPLQEDRDDPARDEATRARDQNGALDGGGRLDGPRRRSRCGTTDRPSSVDDARVMVERGAERSHARSCVKDTRSEDTLGARRRVPH